jgi:hypothetical protein
MKFKRLAPGGHSTAGTWLSEDGRWTFIVYVSRNGRSRGYWAISARNPEDKKWLLSVGLRNLDPPHNIFRTRKEAAAALELALPSAPN